MIGLPRIAVACLVLVAGFVLLLLYGPLAVAIFFSVFRLERNEIAWHTPSLDAYVDLVRNGPLIDALVNTAIVGAAAVALALAFGTLLAFQYKGGRSPWRELLQLIPHASYIDVAGARHMVAGDSNEHFSAAILDFVGRIDQ